MHSRQGKPQLLSHVESNKAHVTSAIGMEESFGRRRARRTSLYTRSVMWITGFMCAALLLATLSQAWSNSNLMQQVQKEMQTLHLIQQQHDNLSKEAQQYQDSAVIESEARQQLGYIRPGEQPLVVVNADNKGQVKITSEQKKVPQAGYWQQWLNVFLGQ